MSIPTLPERDLRAPSLLQAIIPVLFLIGLLAASVYLYGPDSSYGANQIALLLAAGLAAIIGVYNRITWDEIQEGIVNGISISLGAIMILLAVGALIGTWILSGTVPTMIQYGLAFLSPAFFYPAACLLCAVTALTTGSSWTTAGTIGVALIGVAQGLGLDPAITAGAVISGAYFGDKLSPLSDTTNLAPATAGSELFAHIRHMLWTTIPSMAIALIVFSIIALGSTTEAAPTDSVMMISSEIDKHFVTGWHLLIPMLVVFALAVKRFPAFPTIMIGALLGAVFAIVFQAETVLTSVGESEHSRFVTLISGAWTALFSGFKLESGVAAIDELLSRGGMASMLNTVWLVFCAMTFGAVMERCGLLERLIRSVLAMAKSTASLITATLATSIGTNVLAADQFIAIVLPGRLYKPEYERRGLDEVNLSRALEDAGTLTSPLIPWNTCGAFMAGTLGVATFDYLPYAFFNLRSSP